VGDHSRRFLLKVWSEPDRQAGREAGWRATLRDVVDGALHEFSATQELVAYLTSFAELGHGETVRGEAAPAETALSVGADEERDGARDA
jgi:hypothetical protein